MNEESKAIKITVEFENLNTNKKFDGYVIFDSHDDGNNLIDLQKQAECSHADSAVESVLSYDEIEREVKISEGNGGDGCPFKIISKRQDKDYLDNIQ